MKGIKIGGLLAVIVSLLLLAGPAQAHDKLELWIHPYLPATQLIRKFSPLTKYLGKKIGKPIQIRVSKSYKSHRMYKLQRHRPQKPSVGYPCDGQATTVARAPHSRVPR